MRARPPPAIGLALGFLLAAGAAKPAASALPGVSPLDATAFAPALLVLGGAALLAMWLPARRTLSVDPAQALRSE